MEQLEVGQDVAAEGQVEVGSFCDPAVMEAVAVEAETVVVEKEETCSGS